MTEEQPKFASPALFLTHVTTIADDIKKAHEDGCEIGSLLSLAISHAAAEVGGIDELLKYRLGSWEAAAVRGLVARF